MKVERRITHRGKLPKERMIPELILDLERRAMSLAQLEKETLKEGNESLSIVWRRLKEKTERELAQLTQSKKSSTL